uniref:Uncharacterized protein n=1 Tax=Trypanosoma vivax (strain Y486) TaxID=1055687 RepID=G0TW55_TRYVY|nr:hypothetical protein, unlikely [Trypanosoma vivax Y486]
MRSRRRHGRDTSAIPLPLFSYIYIYIWEHCINGICRGTKCVPKVCYIDHVPCNVSINDKWIKIMFLIPLKEKREGEIVLSRALGAPTIQNVPLWLLTSHVQECATQLRHTGTQYGKNLF